MSTFDTGRTLLTKLGTAAERHRQERMIPCQEAQAASELAKATPGKVELPAQEVGLALNAAWTSWTNPVVSSRNC